ncbi:MAG: S8 family serine peptidase, partial [Promethearchaeota archaeon]
AGDDGPDYLTIMSPGGSAAAFTVGAYDTENEKVPDFSGRGPSLDMLTKPDIVAPGVDIVGAKMGSGLSALGLGSFDLGDLGGLSGLFGGESDAEDLDDYYKVDDTTAASAAITAGAAAILMQAFDRATPIALGNVLRDTASSIGFGANDGGAGLLNLQAAFDYLSTKQDPIAPHNRTTGMSQLAFGLVTASGYDTSSIMLMSSYGTTIIALDTRPSQETSMHMLMGMFALRWSNRSPTNLMEFDVKSELHYTTLGSGDYGYTRMVGVLSNDDEIYVALLVESYNLTQYSVQPLSGFKITPYILNLGNAPIDNVSLFLSYSLDIFSDGEDDHGKYSLNTQEIFAYSQSESLDDFYFGLNSSVPFSAFEVGNSSEISSHISNDNLTGSTTFDGSVGLGMKWHFGELPVNKPANVSIAMGFGENRTILDASIAAQWELEPPSNIADSGDLIVIEADIPRVAEMGLEYETRSVVMNVGGNATQANAAFLIAKDEGNGLSIFSRVFTYDEIKPFHAEVMTTTWSPEKMGINTAAWIAAPDLALVMQLLTGTVDLLSLLNLLDNFLMRDLFVIEPISSTSVFPKQLPFAPFDIVFPADFGLYTFMLATTESLGNLTVQKHGNASDWGNATLPSAESVEGYYNFSLFLLAPPITMDGYHRCDYVIETETGWTTNITLERSLRYPRAMMLLDTSHGGGLSFMGGFGDIGGAGDLGGGMDFPLAQDTGGIDIGSGFDLGSLGDLGDLTGLLDAFRMTTFSGLSNLKKTMAASGLDLVETPGMDLNEDLLFQFSAVFSISPTEEFNSTEVDMLRDYTRNGGKLVIFGDQDGTANLTGLNSLLSPFG